jgi:hypothetical protein
MIDLLTISPQYYERDYVPRIKGSSEADDRLTLQMPKMATNLGSVVLAFAEQEIVLSNAAAWDTIAGTDYTVAANRAGANFYLYATAAGLLLSTNATVPSGYTAETSKQIGGLHCLCLSVGTISGHPLTGFLTGDILPLSVWDQAHRPTCSPAGMVYSELAGIWVDIYLQSGTGAATRSAFGATITDSRDWNDFTDDLAAVGKRMLSDPEFQIAAAGGNEKTNIAGSADPVSAGGHRDTTGATAGTSTSAASPSTDISTAANPQQLTVALCGLAPVSVSVNPSGLNTGSAIAAALQTALRAAFPWAGGLTVTYGATYVISCHGSAGTAASVVVTAGASNDCTAALKLGVANGGVEVAGNLGRRMISNIGCEDMAGAMWQWLLDQSYRNDDASYSGTWGYQTLGGNKGSFYRQGSTGDAKLLAGGSWNLGTSCGSRGRIANSSRWYTDSIIGSRGCAKHFQR